MMAEDDARRLAKEAIAKGEWYSRLSGAALLNRGASEEAVAAAILAAHAEGVREEQEACAVVAEEYNAFSDSHSERVAGNDIASAIRRRAAGKEVDRGQV